MSDLRTISGGGWGWEAAESASEPQEGAFASRLHPQSRAVGQGLSAIMRAARAA